MMMLRHRCRAKNAAVRIVLEFPAVQASQAVGRIVERELRAREQVFAAPSKARERLIEL
jgi:hypothetical protein